MAVIRDIATGVAHYLAEELQLDAKDRETVRFGIEYFLGLFVNFGVVVGIALWLGITPYVLAAMVPSGILRLVSGGSHSSTFLRCLVLGTVVMVGLGWLAAGGMVIPQSLLLLLVAFTAVSGFYVVYKWAPADTSAKPIVSPKKKARYRQLSYIFITVWVVAVSVSLLYGGNASLVSGLAVASIGGLWWQICSLTPAGYRFNAVVETLVDKCSVVFQARKSPI